MRQTPLEGDIDNI